jgi:phosphoribosylformylglycinamidine synthase subunit PurS
VKALVHVTLKADVLDPQGKAIRNASAQLGYEAIQSVRQGKLFEIDVGAASEGEARRLVEELCGKLLANPVIEDYAIVRILEDEPAES